MKRCKQILSLVLVVALFAGFNVSIYLLVTGRCANNFGSAFQAKAIEPDKYLPFDKESLIVQTDASLKITEDIPVLDGATALLPVYCAIANAVYPESSCSFDGGGFTPDSRIQYRNTKGAYKAIVDGDADLIFCAAPSAGQLEYAAQQGVQLELVPIGREAFVFLVNKNNPVDSLTQDQLRSVFSGECTNWKQVGGPNRLINPLSRPEGSGSQTRMERFMDGTPMAKSPLAVFGGSIGFSFRYYVEGIVQNGDVKMLAVDGVYPSAESIRDGSYPLTGTFYAVYRKDDTNRNIRLLLDWILSPEGQRLIEQSGYVALS